MTASGATHIRAGVLELLLRVQADRRPLSIILCKIIESCGSSSATGSLPAGLQGDAQAEYTCATDHQPLISAAEHAQKPAKRQRTPPSIISPVQPLAGTLGTDGQNGVPVSADKGGKGSGRRRAREAGSSGAEVASPQGRSDAAWEVLQQLRTVAGGGEAAPEASCSQHGANGAIRALFRVIDRLPGQHPLC